MAGELESLIGAGLTPNEAKLYLLLLKEGPGKATALAAKAGMQRMGVYDTLRQLEKKGLTGKVDRDGVTEFVASPPATLFSYLDEKRGMLESVMPLLAQPYENGEKTTVSVMAGKGGLRTVLEDILELKTDFCVYHGQLAIADALPKFFQIFNEKRKRLGIRARWVLLDTPDARKKAEKVPMTEFRYIGTASLSGGVWWTYADRLVLFVMDDPDQAVTILIKSAGLSKAFQKSFDDSFERIPKEKKR